jgi:hypothetical protein
VKKLSRAERVRLEELTTTDDAIIIPTPRSAFSSVDSPLSYTKSLTAP